MKKEYFNKKINIGEIGEKFSSKYAVIVDKNKKIQMTLSVAKYLLILYIVYFTTKNIPLVGIYTLLKGK